MTSDFIPKDVIDILRTDLSLKVHTIIELLKEKYGYTVSYMRAWMGKQKAIAEIFYDREKSYSEMPHFMTVLQHSNPGSVVHWYPPPITPTGYMQFQIVFWAFKPSIHGFKHCRHVLTIDGTHLYGKYKGTLLVAMGSDANNQIFHVAFAVIEFENGESWPWFIGCIREFVTNRELCVISNRHVGIVKAMNEVGSTWEEPYAHHRQCIRHLASNVHTHFKDIHRKICLSGPHGNIRKRSLMVGSRR
ncbi:unnamed protein product [Cuscuta europaea]|uniref:MULE transposase domain-containing protein n=1 Tax=Cuscuta europaea TaxID=41803 RepID=A0A9P0YQI5_CUSEU|nr:unnamed protein product [Cuscuta europaea]CAH9071967.1 unnamed protein product [Cuscuta europaea]CAH9071969.1 unnamed protein product [Cuscuta europaea]